MKSLPLNLPLLLYLSFSKRNVAGCFFFNNCFKRTTIDFSVKYKDKSELLQACFFCQLSNLLWCPIQRVCSAGVSLSQHLWVHLAQPQVLQYVQFLPPRTRCSLPSQDSWPPFQFSTWMLFSPESLSWSTGVVGAAKGDPQLPPSLIWLAFSWSSQRMDTQGQREALCC